MAGNSTLKKKIKGNTAGNTGGRQKNRGTAEWCYRNTKSSHPRWTLGSTGGSWTVLSTEGEWRRHSSIQCVAVFGIHPPHVRMWPYEEWDCSTFSLEIMVEHESPSQTWTTFHRFLSLCVRFRGKYDSKASKEDKYLKLHRMMFGHYPKLKVKTIRILKLCNNFISLWSRP